MKIRLGFVSNSSSCSFLITNNSKTEKSLLNFVQENVKNVVNAWNKHNSKIYTEADVLLSIDCDVILPVGEGIVVEFDDTGREPYAVVFRRELSGQGKSKSFSWDCLDHWG